MNKLDFSQLRILVIGDLMVDQYIHGVVNRISPEAPVPVLKKSHTSYSLGGAANVALNLKILGTTPILIGVTGDDHLHDVMKELLEEKEIYKHYLIKDKTRQTTLKSRIMSRGQHLLRIDQEDTHNLEKALSVELASTTKDFILTQDIDAIILQDYDKGLFTEFLIKSIMDIAREKKIPVMVDPKFKNFQIYKGVTILKPNKTEFEKAIGQPIDAHDPFLFSYMQKLRTKMDAESLLVTLSNKGLAYVTKNEQKKIAAQARSIVDVCGAGDAVISIVTCAYLTGMKYEEIGLLANITGGIVCEKPGVTQATVDEILSRLKYLSRKN